VSFTCIWLIAVSIVDLSNFYQVTPFQMREG
jgi:hypothetical protein